jgi:DNA-binding XRE family transcriptional regulator
MKYPNIEAERARAGITKETLASKLGVSTGTIKNWQNGKSEIPQASW